MSDPVVQNEGSSGLQENVASALSYVFGFITGLIFLAIEKKNQTVRFHAMQSIIVSVVLIALSIVLNIGGAILPLIKTKKIEKKSRNSCNDGSYR